MLQGVSRQSLQSKLAPRDGRIQSFAWSHSCAIFSSFKIVIIFNITPAEIKTKSADVPYSREQKHVSISDTPMLLIEINSISNMECQK